MSDWKLPWDGGCRCGRVRFRVTQPPLLASACHCLGCQRMTSSAYALSLGLHQDGFQLTHGETVLGGRREEPKHYFCGFCMSWMYTRPSDVPWLVNLRATLLDDHSWFAPYAEFHRREGLPWAVTGAPHSFDSVPENALFGALMQSYAAEGARP
ncbi:MAG TPA: GFA family protein [Caulobacteraceae bacterium]|jgi:hypothetical protein